MSRELQELEDKLLFDELSRRLKLLAIVRRKHRRFEWYRLLFLIPLGVVGYICVWNAFNNDQIVALSLIAIVLFSLSGISGISGERVDARMDALVRLLQEDGILRDTPPGAKHSERS
ncbi:MAG: hypothetical protein M1376_09180 [Planctomycetes bacterium]|nr:hypothetical protein [Planctomycetota bacterium]